MWEIDFVIELLLEAEIKKGKDGRMMLLPPINSRPRPFFASASSKCLN